MNDFFITIVSLTVSGTIVAAIIFLIERLFKHRFSKTWQYYIWLILMVRLIMPITIEANITQGIFQGLGVQSTSDTDNRISRGTGSSKAVSKDVGNSERGVDMAQDVPVVSEVEVSNNEGLTNSRNAPFDVVDNLWIVWLIGLGFILTVSLVDYINFIRYIKAGNRPIEDPDILAIFDDCTMEMKINRNLAVYHNSLVSTPMLIGLWKPFIVLPDNNETAVQFRYIFYHELTHFKRKDILYKWLIQLVTCIHWFNPFMYLIQKEINQVCELSCDEMTLGYLNKEEQRAYGNTLISIAEKEVKYRHNIVSTTLIEGKHNLKERLSNIMNYKELSKASIICSIFMVGVILTVALAAGAVTTRAGAVTTKVGEISETVVSDSIAVSETVNTGVKGSWNSDILNGFEEGNFSAFIYSYSDGEGLKAKRLKLEGNHVLAVIESTSEVPITINYKAKVRRGDFALVAYNDSGNTTLISGTKNEQNSYTLPKGVTILALTGDNSDVSELKIKYNEDLSNYVDNIFYSLPEYRAELLVRALMGGETIGMSDITSIAPYLDEERLNECVKVFLEEGYSFTKDELVALIYYLNPEIKTLCIEALPDISVDDLYELMPYMDSAYVNEYVLSMVKESEGFDVEDLLGLASYLDSDGIRDCVVYLTENNKIDGDELSQFIGYLDSNTMEQCVQTLISNSSFSEDDLAILMSTMDSETLKSSILQLIDNGKMDYDILPSLAGNLNSGDLGEIISKGLSEKGSKAISLDQISELAPYLESDTLNGCMDNIISKKGELDLDFVNDLASYASSEAIGRCMIYAARYNKDVDLDLLVGLSNYANSEDVKKAAEILIKERDMDISDITSLFPYFN